jgi:hypothetical protein
MHISDGLIIFDNAVFNIKWSTFLAGEMPYFLDTSSVIRMYMGYSILKTGFLVHNSPNGLEFIGPIDVSFSKVP